MGFADDCPGERAMISALCFLFVQKAITGPQVLSYADPSANQVTLIATFSAPGLGRRDTAALRILGPLMVKGTRAYTALQLSSYGSQAGVMPRVDVTEGLIQFELVAPKGGLDVIASLLESVVREPWLKPTDFEAVRKDLTDTSYTPWQLAVQGYQLDYAPVKREDVAELYLRIIRPENMRIFVGGSFGDKEITEQVVTRFDLWKQPRALRPKTDRVMSPITKTSSKIAFFELRGKPLNPLGELESARILALVSLGAGKDSSLYRIVRQKNAWSYLQHGFLYPSDKGWIPRLLVASSILPDTPESLEDIRKALTQDIASWDEATLKRAKGMATMSLGREFSFSPFWIRPGGPASPQGNDLILWMSWMEGIGASGLSPEKLSGQLNRVRLVDMKEEAELLLKSASGSIIHRGSQ